MHVQERSIVNYVCRTGKRNPGLGVTVANVQNTPAAALAEPTHLQVYKRCQTLTHSTLIHVFCAVSTLVALWAGANVLPIQGVGVTQRPLVTRVADTGIIQMAQETCLRVERENTHTQNLS